MREISIENNETTENLNYKFSEVMNDRDIIASYLLSALSKKTNPENTTQFKLVKNPSSNRVNKLLILNTIPVTLHYIFLAFRDTSKKLKLEGDLLKMITKKQKC